LQPGQSGAVTSFAATRADALARLAAFLPHAGRAYAARRNHDLGPADRSNVSGLSAAIRRRSITERDIAGTVLAAHGWAAAEKFLTELCWRTYFRGWLELRPEIWRRYERDVDALSLQLLEDSGLLARYRAATGGETGIDCFDAWVAELETHGWLHNHARMWFASIWIFTLKLPWQLGADFFYARLLDACPASNTLSWRWVAGLHSVGKTYLARADNIRSFTGGRFAVTAPLATDAPPLPPDPPVTPHPLATQVPLPTGRIGLWLTSEDLDPESLPLPGIAALAAVYRIGGTPAPAKAAYVAAALADGVARAESRTGIAASRLPEPDLETALADWIADNRLDAVVTPYAPVGPVADRIAALQSAGMPVVTLRRDWDTAAWPHATKGFFAFRPTIPKLLGIGLARPGG
jgi:deoxyribodipyrimidine photo-lyase